MKQYLSLIQEVLNKGIKKNDRTKIGTLALFGTQRRYNLNVGFPLLTTKKLHWKSIVYELLWFIKGDTNIKYLLDHNIKIWNEWPYKKFQESANYKGESMQVFIDKIKNNNIFAQKYGNLGPIYGSQWRNFNNVDQLSQVIYNLKNNPHSRRIIISAWNPPEIKKMLLPPCHSFVQFFVNNHKLSCQLYQRSADVFLGVPFNIASYSLLTMLIAQVCNLELGEFIHTTGDTHIYLNHLEQIKQQLSRKPKKLPQVKLNPKIKSIFNFTYNDIELLNYDFHSSIKGKVAI